ncbi:hypothetical protein OIU76_015138 [Salix suchowensis]|uniref:Uncharacterized protein n=1 Tax=Salix suchowensis TaxID=1278906 RepID=A0ABQ9BKG9_9ROSI|nr:hypothetical protein OIU76_015138 [Salix suchowensis]KAJ6345673.1 hypothetical protein OIU78_008349 [Salix suchowensis]KAJ6385539.1 hypothetical protein OIU77_028676 [Salix suchowensis]
MDLETENRIAAILMKEAAELRQRAEREGVHVYLERPKVRARPNSRFLTATVLGVQQTNRAVELNEMWRVREKELELDDRLRGRSRHDGNSSKNHRDVGNDFRSTSRRHSLNENDTSSYSREDEGLRDEEVDEFLHSRVKRGRGAVGSRMDDTGPYLAPCPDSEEKLSRNSDAKRQRVVFGPEKPSRLKSIESSEEELDKDRLKKEMKVCSRSLDKKHSRKHRSKERSRDKKRKRKGEKRSKH